VLVLLALSAWPAAISDRAVNTTEYVAFFRPEDAP